MKLISYIQLYLSMTEIFVLFCLVLSYQKCLEIETLKLTTIFHVNPRQNLFSKLFSMKSLFLAERITGPWRSLGNSKQDQN